MKVAAASVVGIFGITAVMVTASCASGSDEIAEPTRDKFQPMYVYEDERHAAKNPTVSETTVIYETYEITAEQSIESESISAEPADLSEYVPDTTEYTVPEATEYVAPETAAPETEPEIIETTAAPEPVPETKPETVLRLVSVTSPVARNEEATVTVIGKPSTEYRIKVVYTTAASTAKGLEMKTSDENGNISWTWKVGGKTIGGAHPITVSGGGETIKFNFTTTE